METQNGFRRTNFVFIMTLFLALSLPVWAGGAKDKDKEKENGKLGLIKKAGKLVVGTSADYPPYEFHTLRNGKAEVVGFDIAIAKELAKDLHVKLELKDMRFENLLPSLQNGTIDLIIAGMKPTSERRQLVDFTAIYYHTVQRVLIRTADKDKYPTVDSLKTARLSAQRGTIQVDVATKYILGQNPPTTPQASTPVEASAQVEAITLVEASTIRGLVQNLKNGKVDAIVVEQPVARAYIAKNPDLFLSPVSFKDDEGGTAIAIKKGNGDLALAVEKTIARLIAAKKIDQFVVEANELVEN